MRYERSGLSTLGLRRCQIDKLSESTLFAYENMIRYDPTVVDLAKSFFAIHLCTIVKVYLYKYSYWVDLHMNIHEGKVKAQHYNN